jgi:hypothetical protein
MAEAVEPQEQDEIEAPETEAADSDATESASADEVESPDEGQPEVEAPELAAEDAVPAQEETPEEPEVEAFGFTADRRRFEVPGAQVVRYKEDGQTVEKIVLDRDSWNRFIQPNLRDQAALQRRDADHRKQLEALDPEKNETVIRARALLGSLEGVLASEESLTAFLTDFERNKELWSLKAEKAVAEAKLNGFTTQQTQQQQTQQFEETAAQVAEDIPAVLGGAAEFVTSQWGVPVDQRAMQAAQQQISENIGAYYRYATKQDAEQFGVTEGQIIRDDDAVIRTVHRFATLLAQGNKVEAAKKTNQAALGEPKKAPKTVSAKGSPGAADKPKTFKNKDEWRAHMGLNT